MKYLEFKGESWPFARIVLKNAVLSILTLGIYFPWARTYRRRYLWANVRFQEQNLEYLGTAREILLGYLKLLGILGLLFLGEWILKPLLPDIYPIFRILYSLAMVLFIPWAIYRSRQYLLSRTRWRGIRFAMHPSASQFILTHICTWFLTFITLGLFTPWRLHFQYKAFIENAYLGNQKLEYSGSSGELGKIFFKGLLFTIFSLGLYYFWLKAEMVSFLLSHSKLQGKRLVSRIEGGHLFAIFFLQLLLIPMTFGLALPWVSLFKLRTLLTNIGLEAELDLNQIGQAPFSAGSAFAEEAADFTGASDFGL